MISYRNLLYILMKLEDKNFKVLDRKWKMLVIVIELLYVYVEW